MASGEDRRPVLPRARYGRHHVFKLLGVDDRAEIVVVAGADLQASRALDQHVPEILVDGIENDDAAARRTALAGVAERRKDRPLGRVFEVGVIADHERVLASQLQGDPGEPRAGDARDLAAHSGRTVKLTTETRASATSGAPASSPSPWTMFSTPAGGRLHERCVRTTRRCPGCPRRP